MYSLFVLLDKNPRDIAVELTQTFSYYIYHGSLRNRSGETFYIIFVMIFDEEAQLAFIKEHGWLTSENSSELVAQALKS